MANRHTVLNGAIAALTGGRPEIAAAALRRFLSSNTRDEDARYWYARSLAAQGLFEGAAGEFQRLLTMRPDHARAAVDLGLALAFSGDHSGGLAVLERATFIGPRPAELHFARGICLLGLDDPPAAASSFRSALEENLHIPEVYDNLGAALFRMQQYTEAVDCFRQAIALNPGHASALNNLGDALMRIGDPVEAVAAYRRALALQPEVAPAHAVLGIALLATNDLQGAVDCLERALALDPRLVDGAVNLATAYRRMNRLENAAAAWRRVLAVEPGHAAALLQLGLLTAQLGDSAQAARWLLAAVEGCQENADTALTVANALDRLGRRAEARDVYQRAAVSNPACPEIHDEHGRLLHRLGRFDDALACYACALAIDPGRRKTLLNCGHALESLGRIVEAAQNFHAVLDAEPDDRDAIAGLASCAFRICDWEIAEKMVARLLDMSAGIDSLHPFLRFALDLEPAVLAASSGRSAYALAVGTPQTGLAPRRNPRLRVAYLSPDFREHAVAHAIAGVLERHDRERIETVGVALASPDDSQIAARLTAAVDEFIDCAAMTDAEIVRQLRFREIDVAIDLAGYTAGSRPEVFASRIAPVQVNYLGFPGSTGARYMDCIIADEIVVPYADEHLYVESVIRLPHSYLPFDQSRSISGRPITRAEAGLPTAGFVFCGFSNGYKITRNLFAAWLQLLKEVPGSVLWLRGGNPAMEKHLLRAAGQADIASERLVFSTFVPRMEEHLARLQLADLFLDTFPYNAHTTAAEALWAGVPVVTCRGRTFAGRVGASVLTAAGLPELVCESIGSYQECALRIARSPEWLARLRENLAAARNSAPAFDTARYVRDFEAALLGLRVKAT